MAQDSLKITWYWNEIPSAEVYCIYEEIDPGQSSAPATCFFPEPQLEGMLQYRIRFQPAPDVATEYRWWMTYINENHIESDPSDDIYYYYDPDAPVEPPTGPSLFRAKVEVIEQ